MVLEFATTVAVTLSMTNANGRSSRAGSLDECRLLCIVDDHWEEASLFASTASIFDPMPFTNRFDTHRYNPHARSKSRNRRMTGYSSSLALKRNTLAGSATDGGVFKVITDWPRCTTGPSFNHLKLKKIRRSASGRLRSPVHTGVP